MTLALITVATIRINPIATDTLTKQGKGPSFHTDDFMRGYNAGVNCSSQVMTTTITTIIAITITETTTTEIVVS